jgi:hypothetical protein
MAGHRRDHDLKAADYAEALQRLTVVPHRPAQQS